VGALRRQVREDAGSFTAMSCALGEKLVTQSRAHPQWSDQPHADNLAALVTKEPALGPCPGYACVRRFLKAPGLYPRPRRGPAHSPGAQVAEARFAAREIRSYQSEHVNALWHLDCHHGKVRVFLEGGQWGYPLLLGVLDDCSRLCRHLQWYLREGAEELCHGLSQALLKRALPRTSMTDHGSAMLAAETTQGLARPGILHETTLPFSPSKREAGEILGPDRRPPPADARGRGRPDAAPAQRCDPGVGRDGIQSQGTLRTRPQPGRGVSAGARRGGRPAPASDQLALSFTAQLVRTQRRSDGTLTVAGVRCEGPSRHGHLERLHLRVAAWDLRQVHLVDPKTGVLLCRLYPLDKHRNAAGRRAARVTPVAAAPIAPTGLAPLLGQLIAQYAATGLPPAYRPKAEREDRA
jgi:putative transposase